MSTNPATRRRLRHVPNAISMARIAAAPLLLVLAVTGQRLLFTTVLVVALLSDMLDGWLARSYHLESKRGAQLDSIGDTLLLFATIVGIWSFHRAVIVDNALLCGVMIGLWALENVASLLRYRRLSSFHTYCSKVAGYVLGIYVGVLFVYGHYPWLLYLAAGLSIVGSLEEFALLATLKQWRADVGGLWWVLAERRRDGRA
jgi:CDP-diacylglycerol--glycerol-3-phosphate 3-phosphatidyltransferase